MNTTRVMTAIPKGSLSTLFEVYVDEVAARANYLESKGHHIDFYINDAAAEAHARAKLHSGRCVDYAHAVIKDIEGSVSTNPPLPQKMFINAARRYDEARKAIVVGADGTYMSPGQYRKIEERIGAYVHAAADNPDLRNKIINKFKTITNPAKLFDIKSLVPNLSAYIAHDLPDIDMDLLDLDNGHGGGDGGHGSGKGGGSKGGHACDNPAHNHGGRGSGGEPPVITKKLGAGSKFAIGAAVVAAIGGVLFFLNNKKDKPQNKVRHIQHLSGMEAANDNVITRG